MTSRNECHIDICMSACVDAEFGYAQNNTLPWAIDEEYHLFLKFLASYPEGNSSVLIGRTSFELDAGKPGGCLYDLFGRYAKIMVISNSKTHEEDNIVYLPSIVGALAYLRTHLNTIGNFQPHRLFILGGGEIYKECFRLNLIDRLVISRLPTAYQCTHFIKWLPYELSVKMKLTNCATYDGFNIETYQKIPNITLTSESVTEGHPDKVSNYLLFHYLSVYDAI